ncbi:sensor domain-containing diguanylate cyclase [Pseudomonas sp. Gutcm_11s]|uniref:sensor domain-containing diguanylate cyclase n=1 Tax=Pseudomonas sp. Gutcm_11s TaxID=3026088 RepID=UPI002361D536|nr:diguanylate cyclase [Pseudomonas sp. Gutcm_11s]MDD0841951.1 diguanylate cyclase [Pseudomonas sp. Gutcm_11s]
MTLRKRLFWLFAPLLLLALGFAYLLSQSLILSRFDRQDAALLDAEAKRLQALLDHNLKRNLDLVLSYAKWDDTYDFMRGQHPDYVRRNMDPEALQQINFDFMLLLDEQDRVQAEQWMPPDLPDMITLGSERPRDYRSLRDAIVEQIRRLHQPGREDLRGQIVVVQGVPLVLAMGGISNNQDSLPSLGTLVAGHFIDGERSELLQSQVNGSLRLLPPDVDHDGWRALPTLGTANLNRIEISPRRVLDENRQQLDLLFRNSLGEPQLLMELTRERRLYQEGRKAISIFLAEATGVGLIAWVLIYLGLEFGIMRRVSRMHRDISAIGPDSNHQRIRDSGNDELGSLSQEVNRMLERLEQSETRDREILDAIQDGYFELDHDGHITAINRALCGMLGYSEEELLGNSFEALMEQEDLERAVDQLTRAHQTGDNVRFVAPLQRRDGSRGHYETRFSIIHDGQNTFAGYRGIMRDISDQVAYQNRLLDMAYTDPLTGLHNRKAFTEQLPLALEKTRRSGDQLALIYLDLDRFKEVNDRFGHDIGDLLLQGIAERLRGAMRQPDQVYRLGGDEFTLIVAGGNAEVAQRVALRLLATLKQPMQIEQQVIDFVTPSIGIALYPEHADDAESLVKAADSAMYEAKRERGRACLYRPQRLSSSRQSG